MYQGRFITLNYWIENRSEIRFRVTGHPRNFLCCGLCGSTEGDMESLREELKMKFGTEIQGMEFAAPLPERTRGR
jgi:hypothetical protein